MTAMTKDGAMSIEQLKSYDHYLVMFSGGKDSIACLLHLLEAGVDKNKIELWHHDVDGREGSELMDWAVTRDYCRKFAASFNLPIYFSWKMGGFEREMLRQNAKTAPVQFEYPTENGIEIKQVGGKRGKESTRMKFPQVSPDLSVRWCSAYLKIDVAAMAISNQKRFEGSVKTLVITGERAQESAARAKYEKLEAHRSDNRNGKRVVRHVDHWRPVHGWDEQEVWDIIKRFSVNPHPAYKLGWGRVSCAACIFGSKDQWASLKAVDSEKFDRVAAYEAQFGVTIQRKHSISELADCGEAYENMSASDMAVAVSAEYNDDIIVESWELPAGAFGESCGPV